MTWFQRHQNTGVPAVTPRVTLSTTTELNAQQKGELLLEIIVRRHDAHFLPFLVELVSVHHSLPLCAASLESAKTPSEAPARDPEGGPGCCIFSKNNGEQSRGTSAFPPSNRAHLRLLWSPSASSQSAPSNCAHHCLLCSRDASNQSHASHSAP